MEDRLVRIGKFISLILRHKPEIIKIKLDKNGWANVEELIKGIAKTERDFNINLLKEIVETNNKKRYEFNEDFTKIRACQGHSVNVDVELLPAEPPKILYHGTADRFLASIRAKGLKKMNRQYVHLSKDYETAVNVGARHGQVVVIKVLAEKMHKDGKKFFISKNGVWLTGDIDVKYLEF